MQARLRRGHARIPEVEERPPEPRVAMLVCTLSGSASDDAPRAADASRSSAETPPRRMAATGDRADEQTFFLCFFSNNSTANVMALGALRNAYAHIHTHR